MPLLVDQLRPLELNPSTGEPFLRLRNHPNIILTPARREDAPHIVPLFNDPRLYEWFRTPPFPYLREHADDFIESLKHDQDEILRKLKEARGLDTLVTVDGPPVSFIRELKGDGSDTDKFIGNISLQRCHERALIESIAKLNDSRSTMTGEKESQNSSPPADDLSPVWTIGDFLAPSHHGKGIMTDAIETLIYDWAVPRMNARQMVVGMFVGNKPSRRVFEKNGFEFTETIRDFTEARGVMRSIDILALTISPDASH